MPNMLEEKDWDLLQGIKDENCTPFPGAGAYSKKILVSPIANELAKKYDYPMGDPDDLTRVDRFVTVVEDLMTPKEEVCKIQEAFTVTTFLFLSHRIADWDFRVLFRILAGYLKRCQRKYLYMQLIPGNDVSRAQKEKAQKYLDHYFDELNNQVYWHDCHKFSAELRTRWEAFNGGT
jgi:hypothetical protein